MAMTLISTNPDSSDVASVTFTSGIDSTYKLYIFKWYDIHSEADSGVNLLFNGSVDGGSNYNVTKTTTFFRSIHNEANSSASLDYEASFDIAQGTGGQAVSIYLFAGNDESAAGELYLFNPSNTTYVKHFYSRSLSYQGAAGSGTDYGTNDVFTAGYFNNTNDIDAVEFKLSSGNMNGVIKMYGVS